MNEYVVFYGEMNHNKQINDFATKEEAKNYVMDKVNKSKSSHYVRSWYMPEYSAWAIDFGSHVNFYFISDFNYKDGDKL